jgi:hypothetical protein
MFIYWGRVESELCNVNCYVVWDKLIFPPLLKVRHWKYSHIMNARMVLPSEIAYIWTIHPTPSKSEFSRIDFAEMYWIRIIIITCALPWGSLSAAIVFFSWSSNQDETLFAPAISNPLPWHPRLTSNRFISQNCKIIFYCLSLQHGVILLYVTLQSSLVHNDPCTKIMSRVWFVWVLEWVSGIKNSITRKNYWNTWRWNDLLC